MSTILPDAAASNWVDRHAPPALRPWLKLGRFDRPAGIWLGWSLQVALITIGVLLPLVYFIGAIFAVIWIYCFITGRRLDRQKAAYLRDNPAVSTDQPVSPNN